MFWRPEKGEDWGDLKGATIKSRFKGKKIPAAFAWTGRLPLFEDAGFKAVGKRDGAKQRVRRSQ
jgi:hypothetical protein